MNLKCRVSWHFRLNEYMQSSKDLLFLNPVRQQLVLKNANNVVIDNVKGFTSFTGGDGIDCVGGCTNVVVKNCFVRSADDATVCDGGDADITWENDVLCPMRVHSFIIGVGAGNVNNYLAKNCFVLNEDGWPDYEGVFGIYANGGLVQNVTFQNITVERIRFGSMLEIYPYSYWDNAGWKH